MTMMANGRSVVLLRAGPWFGAFVPTATAGLTPPIAPGVLIDRFKRGVDWIARIRAAPARVVPSGGSLRGRPAAAAGASLTPNPRFLLTSLYSQTQTHPTSIKQHSTEP